MSAEFIQLVREGLQSLRSVDPEFKVFGAAAHRYQLLRTAREDEVATFEAAHGIELPTPYRRFLLELGNGGAGPHYGVFPLGMWDGSGRLEPWGEYGAGVLREPFPHQAHWNLPPGRFEDPAFDDDDAEDAWYKSLEDEYWDMSLVRGAFPISHQGCAFRNLLVVTGSERGKVWLDGRAGNQGIGPEQDAAGDSLAFEAWYLRWLGVALTTAGA